MAVIWLLFHARSSCVAQQVNCEFEYWIWLAMYGLRLYSLSAGLLALVGMGSNSLLKMLSNCVLNRIPSVSKSRGPCCQLPLLLIPTVVWVSGALYCTSEVTQQCFLRYFFFPCRWMFRLSWFFLLEMSSFGTGEFEVSPKFQIWHSFLSRVQFSGKAGFLLFEWQRTRDTQNW